MRTGNETNDEVNPAVLPLIRPGWWMFQVIEEHLRSWISRRDGKFRFESWMVVTAQSRILGTYRPPVPGWLDVNNFILYRLPRSK